ncbi:MAG TPA: hypothetical protein VIY28_01415 [Pseudonocardiaceae bacterium]
MLLGKASEAVFKCPLPVVAAANGHAIADGGVLRRRTGHGRR